MPRRNLVPLVLLAVLVVLTAVFAVFGARSAPTSTTIQVQNAAEKTFGTPTGANSWIMELVTSVNVGVGTANGTTARVIKYIPPKRMLVYNVNGTSATIAGVLHQPAVSCVLKIYSSMFEGEGSWKQQGGTFTRMESLADYSARVPQGNGSTCVAVASATSGKVHETATVRSDYLVKMRVVVDTPAHGTEGELLNFLKIGNVRVSTLKQ